MWFRHRNCSGKIYETAVIFLGILTKNRFSGFEDGIGYIGDFGYSRCRFISTFCVIKPLSCPPCWRFLFLHSEHQSAQALLLHL
jgi:hypothetical protein